MQDFLGSFFPFYMVANKPQDSGGSLDRIPLWPQWTEYHVNLWWTYSLQRKKILCVLKLASLLGYLLLRHNLTHPDWYIRIAVKSSLCDHTCGFAFLLCHLPL